MAFAVLFGIISISHFRKYLILKPASESPIVYDPAGSKVNDNGKGKIFYFTVLYQRKEYKLDVAKSDYLDIKNGKYPKIYYSADLDTLFYSWNLKRSLRIALVFFVFFVISSVLVFKKRPSISS